MTSRHSTVSALFQSNLLDAIESSRISLSALGRRSGYDRSYIRKVMQGRANPTILFADCVAQALGSDLISLLSNGETKV